MGEINERGGSLPSATMLDGSESVEADRDRAGDLLALEARGRLAGHPGLSIWAGGDLDYPIADDLDPWTLGVSRRSGSRG